MYHYIEKVKTSSRITMITVVLFSLVLLFVTLLINFLTQRFLWENNVTLLQSRAESVRAFYHDAESYYDLFDSSERVLQFQNDLQEYRILYDDKTVVILVSNGNSGIYLNSDHSAGIQSRLGFFPENSRIFFSTELITGKNYAIVRDLNAPDGSKDIRFLLSDAEEAVRIEKTSMDREALESPPVSAVSASVEKKRAEEKTGKSSLLYTSVRLRASDSTSIYALVILNKSDGDGFIFTLNIAMFFAGMMGIALLFITSRFMVKKALSPLIRLSQEAKKLNYDNLEYRISMPEAKDEVYELSHSLNRMFSEMTQAMEAQKRFTSDASHELRIPLTVILGYVEILRRLEPTDKELMQEAIDSIDQEASNMKNLIERLLYIARLQNKTIVMNLRDLDATEVVSGIAVESAYIYLTHQIVDTTKEHGGYPRDVAVFADEDLLKQVLRGIVENAVKYSPEGSRIEIGLHSSDNMTSILVRDNGIGIKPEHLKSLTNRFFRVDTARGRETGGTGLGLSIAKNLVKSMNGSMEIRSEYGAYTEVEIRLPAKGNKSSSER